MPNKNHTKNPYIKKHRQKNIYIFQFQMSIIIYLMHICYNIFYRILKIQVDNLNLTTNLTYY